MAVCEEAGRRYRDTCLLLCEKGEKREHMKKFYAWYQKHITGAIFTGLILGILTGLLTIVNLLYKFPIIFFFCNDSEPCEMEEKSRIMFT